ncbi:hypothetical protein J3F84DRAFT_225747 [Trichoderma pleuroticola]
MVFTRLFSLCVFLRENLSCRLQYRHLHAQWSVGSDSPFVNHSKWLAVLVQTFCSPTAALGGGGSVRVALTFQGMPGDCKQSYLSSCH